MPRVASDKTITHRLELGLPEREKLDLGLKAYIENNRIDGITATLQAAGSALGGAGLLWAAIVAGSYFAPKLLRQGYEELKNFTEQALDPIVSPATDDITSNLKKNVYDAQNKVVDAQARVNRFCSGAGYDAQQCTIAQNDLTAAKKQRDAALEAAKSAPQDLAQGFGLLPFGQLFSTGFGYYGTGGLFR